VTKPSPEFSSRHQAATRWRDPMRSLIEQAFRFCAPNRVDDFSTAHYPSKEIRETDTFTSIGEELATDLAGDLVTYYMPSTERWFDYEVIIPVEKEQVNVVTALVKDREDTLWDIISATNLNDIAPALHFETATHGTPALWISLNHIQQPIHCEVVPPHELLIVPGHLGILDRFRETTVYASTLPALFAQEIAKGDVSLSERMLAEKIKKPAATCKVCWGFWLDWKDPAMPVWRSEITVDGKRVTPEKPVTLGPMAGSCPLLVGRFNPQKCWGRGPAIRALPDFRTADELADLVLSGMDRNLNPPLIYAEDGVIDLAEGITPGRAYPAHRSFNGEQMYLFPSNINMDQGYFTEERWEDKLRRAFYQDGPRQRGDTPPTAAQWLDERRRVQQRLGKPSAPIWSELILPMIQRFETLAVQLGRIDGAITHDGQAITVVPLSPLQKAQNQDKVMITRSNLDLALGMLGPEGVPQFINVPTTLENIRRASGDELLAVNEEPAVAPAPAAQ
jgi:hypothetical protein